MPTKYSYTMKGGMLAFEWQGPEGFLEFFNEFVVPNAERFGLKASIEKGEEPAQPEIARV